MRCKCCFGKLSRWALPTNQGPYCFQHVASSLAVGAEQQWWQRTHLIMRDMLLNLSQLLLAQLHIEGCNVLLQVFDALCARNRKNIIALVVHPGERQLAQRAALLVCKLPHLLHQLLVLQLHEFDPVIDSDFQSKFVRTIPLMVLRLVACHSFGSRRCPAWTQHVCIILTSLSCSLVPVICKTKQGLH